MPKLIAALLTVAMVAGILPARADATADAKKLGDLFCLVAKDARDGGEFGRLYLVTRSLGAAIGEAIRKNDAIAIAEPGDKPPLGDGVPFQSYPDTPPVCHAGKFTEADGKQIVEVQYIFTATPDADWTDRLVVASEDGRLRIDDVLFGTDSSGGGLRSALIELFKN
jgi:hypothetical protein